MHGDGVHTRETTMATQVERDQGRTTLDAIYRRRAVRSYAPDRLGETTIRTLLEAAVQAPTAMHREPWAFVVIQDVALLKRYSDRAKTMAQEEATTHRDLLKAPGVSSSGGVLGLLASPGFNIFYDASTLIVVCGKPMGSFVIADCWLAAENLMLAACAIGLGTCCIGFAVPALNTPEVKQELAIPWDVTAVAPIIVGVPRAAAPPVSRKPPEILRWARGGP
jgi:nitroreductase